MVADLPSSALAFTTPSLASKHTSIDDKRSIEEHAVPDAISLPSSKHLLAGLPPHRRTLKTRPLEQMLHAVIIMCCNIIGWLPPPNRSNPFKNATLQDSAFKLLLTILAVVGAHRSSALSSRQSFVQVLKRFVVPSVLSCAESKSSSLFAQGLQLFVSLWEFKDLLGPELGILLEHYRAGVLVGVAQQRRKLALLNVLASTLFASPKACLDMAFNFDGHPDVFSPDLFRGYLEGAVEQCLAQRVRETIGYSHYEQSEAELRRQALVFIVHVLTLLSQTDCLTDAAAPGSDELDADVAEVLSIRKASAATPSRRSRSSSMQDGKFPDRSGTSKFHRRCPESFAGPTPLIQLHRTGLTAYWENGEKLSAAVKAIKAEAATVAAGIDLGELLGDFLFMHNNALDKSQVGDVLSGFDDKVCTNRQYNAMRVAYMRHFDFVAMTFDHAIRVYLTDGNITPHNIAFRRTILASACERN
jgi:hypothetical protein